MNAFKGGLLINHVSTLPLGKNVVVVLVADHLVFPQDTFVRFQQRKIQVTCTFCGMTSTVVGFHEDATELLGFH